MDEPPVQLRVLGTLDLRGVPPDAAAALVSQPRAASLLTYLAMADAGAYQRRDYLSGLFWPETDQARARANLRKSVFTLRRLLGAATVESRGDEDVRLAPSSLWCDAAAFMSAIERGLLRRALELYRGSLLPGFHVPECRGFQDWLDATRRSLARDAIKAAIALADEHVTASERTDVGDLVHFILRLDSDIEDEHQLRKLLALLEHIGDRAGAMHLYENFRQRLWDSYQAVPAAETRGFVERMKMQ